MKCPTCAGTVKRDVTNLPVELETGLLYVRHVPADICDQCDDVFIPDDVVAKLAGIVKAAKKQRVEVQVVDYQGVA